TIPPAIGGCPCRFGLPPPTLAFSADGQYLVAGWPVGKGATPLRVYRVADATLVQTLELADFGALWDRTGHRLYLLHAADPSRSHATAKVFAMNLSTGVETQVVFAPGESLPELQVQFQAAEFWPNT